MTAGQGMNTAEWLALAGLLRLMMGAHGALSLREHRFVGQLASRLGPDLWTHLALAERDLPSEEAVRRQAARVVRPERQRQIRQILAELAHDGGAAPAERAILDWLDALWAE